MKIAIVGAGAIDGWLGVGLARAGQDVRVLARDATRVAIERNGLRLFCGEKNANRQCSRET